MKISLPVFILSFLIVALVLAVFLSPFAASAPDGLEKVAEEKGFAAKGERWSLWRYSPLPDYLFPGFGESPVATGLAGLFGTGFVFGLSYFLAVLLRKKVKKQKDNKGFTDDA